MVTMITGQQLVAACVIVTGVIMLIEQSYCAQLNSYSACYGNTDDNYIKGSCASGEKIVMESVHVYAKPSSSGCPNQVTSLSVPPFCCEFDENDCGKKYEGESHQEYYKNCDGKTTCLTTPVAWEETPDCNTTTTYLERTNYMVAYFYCVAENDIQTISGNSSTTDAEVFLWNTGYPDGNMTQSSSYTCSVASSCASKLRVRALNLMFTSNAGACGQSLTIKDGGRTTTIGCESNTDLIPTYIYESESYYLEIEANNTFGFDAGKFFLLTTANDSLSNLTLACGSSKGKGYIQQANIPECTPSSPTQPTTPVSTQPPTTPLSTTPASPTPQTTPALTQPPTTPLSTTPASQTANAGKSTGEDDQSNSNMLIIIVVVIILVIIIVILVLIILRHKLRECCCKEKKHDSEEKSLSSQFENPLLNGFIPTGPQIAPKSTFKQNNVAPAPFTAKPEIKLPPIALVGAGEASNEEGKHQAEDGNVNTGPLKPKRLPPLALFQANTAFRENLEKVKKKKRRLRRKKEALKRRESELEVKEAVIMAKERTLEKRLSGIGQTPGTDPEPQQDVNPAPPQPLHRWSSILPSPATKMTFSTLASVVTAFQPKRHDSICIDVTNADDGTVVSTYMNENNC